MLSDISNVYQNIHCRIKDKEKALVYQEISNFAPCSRKTVALKTGIRQMTVSRVVSEMLNDRLIFETEESSGDRRGRPEIQLRPNLNRLTAISLYLQARELHAALVNIGEEILKEDFVILDTDILNEDFIAAGVTLINRIVQSVPENSELLGVAFSLVGTVNSEKKTWISASRWHQIQNLELSALEKTLSLPILVNRMQDAELEYLVQKTPRYQQKNVLFLHWGFGISASYSYKGEVLNSSIGRFGEIGHTRVSGNSTKLCQCGARGCLETEAALWSLQDNLRRRIGIASTDERELGITFKNRDLLSEKIIANALKHVSFALTNLLQIFFPDAIIFYGPFTENEALFSTLSAGIRKELPAYIKDSVEIIAVNGGFHGCIRGSLYPFFKKRFRELFRVNTTKI